MDVFIKILLLLSLILVPHARAGLSISSYNIRNFDHDPEAGQTNVTELGRNIKEFKSDVMTFIEVVNLPAFKKVVAENLPGYMVESSTCGGFGEQKLAVVYDPKVFRFISSSEDMTFSSTTTSCGDLRPAFLVTLEHKSNKQTYVFAALHLKAGGSAPAMQERWTQYELLEKLAKKYKSQNLIMLGDLNTTGYSIQDEDFAHFSQFLTSSSLRTISENLSCTAYWAGTLTTGQHQSSILDHIVLKNEMYDEVKEIYFGSHCAKLDCQHATPSELGLSYKSVSDHCPIQVIFN
jgi:endonuclease/exonuclease/phosphatase family metal-dependent hydrolase